MCRGTGKRKKPTAPAVGSIIMYSLQDHPLSGSDNSRIARGGGIIEFADGF